MIRGHAQPTGQVSGYSLYRFHPPVYQFSIGVSIRTVYTLLFDLAVLIF
jgi:hypothetical protein